MKHCLCCVACGVAVGVLIVAPLIILGWLARTDGSELVSW